MGRELVSLDSVPAGNVFGISGLEGKILKNGTICSISPGINLAGVQLNSAPIVRVALEPVWPGDLPKLVDGLRLLNQADSCVQVLVQDSGEHVILTAGELHLEVWYLWNVLTLALFERSSRTVCQSRNFGQ
jgi:ribosome assembly protein 1